MMDTGQNEKTTVHIQSGNAQPRSIQSQQGGYQVAHRASGNGSSHQQNHHQQPQKSHHKHDQSRHSSHNSVEETQYYITFNHETHQAIKLAQPNELTEEFSSHMSRLLQHVAPIDEDHELLALLATLPPSVRDPVYLYLKLNNQLQLTEVVIDVGRKPSLYFIDDSSVDADREVTPEDVHNCLTALLAGDKEFTSDNRIGISKTLHRISALRNRQNNIVGLTYRIGRHLPGICQMLEDILYMASQGKSVLLLGAPGVGKTTLLRDTARTLADLFKKRVMIIDTSNEIAGDGDVPHHCIGKARRTQIKTRDNQFAQMLEAVQNHTPQIVVIDEISTRREVDAARTIAQRGVSLIATAHGTSLRGLMKNPVLTPLIGGISPVTVGDRQARRGPGGAIKKTILERSGTPTFDMLIELNKRNDWRIFTNVADTVDALLADQHPCVERRWLDDKKSMRSTTERVTNKESTAHEDMREISSAAHFNFFGRGNAPPETN